MGNQTNNQKVTKFTMKTFFAATLAASAVAGDEAIRARWAAQRDIASMARDLEDCFPTGQLGNSVWRPTTIVKPGRMWAEAGQGPASRVDCDGKEVGESRLVFPTYKKGATTRTAGYSYDRTLLETRQPDALKDMPCHTTDANTDMDVDTSSHLTDAEERPLMPVDTVSARNARTTQEVWPTQSATTPATPLTMRRSTSHRPPLPTRELTSQPQSTLTMLMPPSMFQEPSGTSLEPSQPASPPSHLSSREDQLPQLQSTT